MRIFEEIVFSIYDIKSYPEFMKDSGGKTFLFGVLLTTLYFVIVTAAPTVLPQETIEGDFQIIEVVEPDFSTSHLEGLQEELFQWDETESSYVFVDVKKNPSAVEPVIYDYPANNGLLVAYSFIWMLFSFFFEVIFVALGGLVVASCRQVKMTFGQIYKMGIYTRTVPLLFQAICCFLALSMPEILLRTICFAISMVYLSAGMKQQQKSSIAEG